MIILVSLLVALVGAILYWLPLPDRMQEIGRILFFTGMLVTLLRMGPASISLLR